MPSAYYSDLCQAIAKGSQAVMEKYQTPAKFCINLVGVFRFMANMTDTKGLYQITDYPMKRMVYLRLINGWIL